jgi:hypothetical protein
VLFQTSKLPPTTPKKRKPSTSGKTLRAGESSPTVLKKKQKKDVPKDTNVSGLDPRDVAPSLKSKIPPSTSNVMLEHIDSNISTDNPQVTSLQNLKMIIRTLVISF